MKFSLIRRVADEAGRRQLNEPLESGGGCHSRRGCTNLALPFVTRDSWPAMKKGAVSVRANRLFPATRTKDKLHCYYRYYRARLVKEKERERERE